MAIVHEVVFSNKIFLYIIKINKKFALSKITFLPYFQIEEIVLEFSLSLGLIFSAVCNFIWDHYSLHHG